MDKCSCQISWLKFIEFFSTFGLLLCSSVLSASTHSSNDLTFNGDRTFEPQHEKTYLLKTPNKNSNQPAHSLLCPHEEILYPLLSKMHPVTILIRLCEWAGWFESSLGARPKVRFLTLWLKWFFAFTRFTWDGPLFVCKVRTCSVHKCLKWTTLESIVLKIACVHAFWASFGQSAS